jgi:preprotein translocase subunit SecA
MKNGRFRKEAYEVSEKTLLDILPEAFAVVKETARRFKDNSQISVTASALDREFSGIKAYVSLKETNQFGKINGTLQEKKLPGT